MHWPAIRVRPTLVHASTCPDMGMLLHTPGRALSTPLASPLTWSCRCAQTFAMGDQQEMLITVSQPEGQAGKLVKVVSDCSTPLVLHWGVRTGAQGEWLLAPEQLWPAGTSKATDIAAESACKVGLLVFGFDACSWGGGWVLSMHLW